MPAPLPTEEQLFQKLRSIIVEQLGVEPADVQLPTKIMDDLGADSLDGVELIMAIEEEFSIEIPDGEFEERQLKGRTEDTATVQDVLSFLMLKLAESR